MKMFWLLYRMRVTVNNIQGHQHTKMLSLEAPATIHPFRFNSYNFVILNTVNACTTNGALVP